jgi:GNAT superfamily N-acetyltransferase
MPSIIAADERKVRFGDGLDIDFRRIRHDDAALLKEFFQSHSKETILHRYFAPLRELSADQIQKFVDLDYENDMAIVGLVPYQCRQRMLCVGRFYRDRSTNSAEIAITVHDDFQRRGVGAFLLRALIRIAHEYGIETLTADVLADNHAMMGLLRKYSSNLEIGLEAGVYHVVFPLEEASINAKSLPKFGEKMATTHTNVYRDERTKKNPNVQPTSAVDHHWGTTWRCHEKKTVHDRGLPGRVEDSG